MKPAKLLLAILFSIAVAACGGGGGSTGGGQGNNLPAGYVAQGGLTWMPVTFRDTYANADAYCANTSINGQTGWRMPTQTELSALYESGAMIGQGWTLDNTRTSTPGSAGTHYVLYMVDGTGGWGNDTPHTYYVSCVRGGNSVPPPAVSTLTFPLLSGFQSMVANGYTKSLTISGSCSGTGSVTKAPASTTTTFEGQSALSSAITESGTYSNCTPASIYDTGTYYYNSSNYSPLGGTGMGGVGITSGALDYGVFQTTPTIPASVQVGYSGPLGTVTLWTNSSKATPNGRIVTSFFIEPDTASTAIVLFSSIMYDGSNTAVRYLNEYYRMNSTGALTLISIHTHNYSSGSTLVVTAN